MLSSPQRITENYIDSWLKLEELINKLKPGTSLSSESFDKIKQLVSKQALHKEPPAVVKESILKKDLLTLFKDLNILAYSL